eukprot:m.361659 g.361659  ORF g.361659 m.361659 type:complete len:198 (+) comp56009_c0_seq6:201-794(+)
MNRLRSLTSRSFPHSIHPRVRTQLVVLLTLFSLRTAPRLLARPALAVYDVERTLPFTLMCAAPSASAWLPQRKISFPLNSAQNREARFLSVRTALRRGILSGLSPCHADSHLQVRTAVVLFVLLCFCMFLAFALVVSALRSRPSLSAPRWRTALSVTSSRPPFRPVRPCLLLTCAASWTFAFRHLVWGFFWNLYVSR